MHFCVAGLTSCGGTILCSSRSKFVCQRMWPGPLFAIWNKCVHCMRVARGVYTLWVELSVILAYGLIAHS